MNRLQQVETVIEPVMEAADLSTLLNELSFSYMMVTSAQQSLEDLDISIRELGDLVDGLRMQVEA
jgi:hypothetical protein